MLGRAARYSSTTRGVVVVVVVDGVAVAYFERTHLESFVFTNLRSIY